MFSKELMIKEKWKLKEELGSKKEKKKESKEHKRKNHNGNTLNLKSQ